EPMSSAASFSPGAAAHLQALLGGEVAGLVGGVDGLAALGAVVESPGDQVAVAALAPAHRPHQGLRSPSVTEQGPLGSRNGRGDVWAGRWATLAAGHES